MSDMLTPEQHAHVQKQLDEVHQQHAEKAAKAAAENAKALDVANGQIQNMHSANNVHEAEKSALGQSLNELLQANIRLRAATILLEKQGKEGFALRDGKITELTNEIKNRDAAIAALQNKLEVANKVIAASTNLVPAVDAKPADAPVKDSHPAKHK
jgi:hypothetical protein